MKATVPNFHKLLKENKELKAQIKEGKQAINKAYGIFKNEYNKKSVFEQGELELE